MHTTPHDKLFKAVFGRVDNAIDLLCSVLPAAVVQSIDVTNVTPEPAGFVDDRLRERLPDLLYSVQPTPGELPLYMLLEHKSSPEVLTAFTATRYTDVCDVSFEALDDFLDHHLGPGAQETCMTLAERIRQEERQRMEAVMAEERERAEQEIAARERQRAEQEVAARERKRAEAVMAEERRALLYDLLEARGLAVSESVRARIEACDSSERLARWLRRSVTASSAEQVLHDG